MQFVLFLRDCKLNMTNQSGVYATHTKKQSPLIKSTNNWRAEEHDFSMNFAVIFNLFDSLICT